MPGSVARMALCVSLLLVGCAPSAPPEAIVLGHFSPRSGPSRTAGEQARQGILLAVEDANREETRPLGRRVEVHHVDLRATENAPAHETVRLITVNRAVGLLGGLDPAPAEAIARAALPYGIPLVTPTPLPFPVADNAFSTSVSAAHKGTILARFANEDLKATHAVILLDSHDPVAPALADAFVSEFTRTADRRSATWTFTDRTALGELAPRLGQTKPGVLLFAGSADDLTHLGSRLSVGEPRPPILFGGEGSGWQEALSTVEMRNGVYGLTTFVVDESTPRAQEFARRYRERFQVAPDATAASAFEGAALLCEALLRTESSRPDRVREALAALEGFESLTGPLTFDKGTQHARRPVFLMTANVGKVRLVKRIDAEAR